MGSQFDKHVVYLHGDLDLKILEARSLPNMDLLTEHIRRFLSVLEFWRRPFSGRKNDSGVRNMITSDPYVSICIAGDVVARTRVIANSQNPIWNESLRIPVAHPVSQVRCQFLPFCDAKFH